MGGSSGALLDTFFSSAADGAREGAGAAADALVLLGGAMGKGLEAMMEKGGAKPGDR